MTREQAISYLRNSGFSEEQINEIVKALEPTTKNDLGVDMINQLITKTANTMNVSKAHVATAIDTLINTSQPYKPIQGLCKSAKKNDLGGDCISREQALNEFCIYNSYDSIGVDKVRSYLKALPSVTPQEPIHGKCNQCKHYEGVHNVQGHAPCSYHKIGGVLWNWYCSQFESEDKE